MSTSIGEVNINLRMSLAQFKQDTRNGTAEVTRATKEMSASFRSQSQEARGSLALISEEIGVSIPRHLRNLIATVPGVGKALAAAFSSVAVIALLGVIVDIAKKIQELSDETDKAAESWKKFNQSVDELVHKSDSTASGIATIGEGLTKLNTEAANASVIGKTVVGVFSNFADGAKLAYPALAGLINLLHKGDPEAQAFAASIGQFYERLKDLERSEGPKAALQAITNELTILYQRADRGNPALEQTIHTLEQTQSLVSHGVNDQFNKSIQDAAEAAKKALDAEWESYNRNLKILKQSSIRKVTDTALTTEDLKRTGTYTDQAPGLGPNTGKFPTLPGNASSPVYTGPNPELVKIQNDQKEALKAAADIYEKTRTASEKYAEEVAVLNQLLKDGKIDQDTFNRAMKDAKLMHDTLAQSWAHLGAEIGHTLEQAALFGRGWTDSLKAIGIELAKLLIQMLFFKSTASTPGGGGGGFGSIMGSLLGGLFGGGKASGGSVNPGMYYEWQEHGHEFFAPKVPGTVVPTSKMSTADKSVENHFHMNIQGVTDADSFKKSSSQIAADMLVMMSQAARRTR